MKKFLLTPLSFKKWIVFFIGTIIVFSVGIFAFGKIALSSVPDSSTLYFLESNDSVVSFLKFGTKLEMNYNRIGRLKISNDSIYLEGERLIDKYGAVYGQAPNKFIATFKNGEVNTNELVKFINLEKSLFSTPITGDIPTITKITIREK